MRCKSCGQEIIKRRSSQTNKALHLFFTWVAQTLSDAGFDVRTTLKEDFELPWSPELVKELLWRPLQKVMFKKQSTTQLTSQDINKLLDIMARELGKKGIETPEFPSIERLIEYEKNTIH